MNTEALEKLAIDCLDPERFGHAVSFEVREAAREALGLRKAETVVDKCDGCQSRSRLWGATVCLKDECTVEKMVRLNVCHNYQPSPSFVECSVPKTDRCAGCRWDNV